MTRMSPRRARGTRANQLHNDVAQSARCGSHSEEHGPAADWFREHGEPYPDWKLRRAELLAYCAGCPVITQCRELALRYDDANEDPTETTTITVDDHVRGGLTAAQLADTRRTQRATLDRAITRDQPHHQADEDRRAIATLTQTMRGYSVDQRASKTTKAAAHATHTELATRRAARRTANGWSTAA